GLFLLLKPGLGNNAQGWVLVAFINGLMALPFVVQVLRGPLSGLDTNSRQLADQLGIIGWYRWHRIYWPLMRRPMALGLANGMAVLVGDFGGIARSAMPGQATLPVLLSQQLGNDRVYD